MYSDLHTILPEFKPAPGRQWGFFSQPFIAVSGPYAGKIIKLYGPAGSPVLLQQLKQHHDAYYRALAKTGIQLPQTEMLLLQEGKKLRACIVQEPFPANDLVRFRILEGDENAVIANLIAMLNEAKVFVTDATKPVMGFHPTTRNFAWRDNSLIYFDTFPPMLCSQWEINNLVLRFTPVKLARVFRPVLRPFMGIVTREYYDEVKMIQGITGSVCRLRPEFAQKSLQVSQEWLAGAGLSNSTTRKLNHHFMNPPSLPEIWIRMRSWLGKEGNPNLPKKNGII